MNVLKVDLQASDAAEQFAKSLHHTGFAVLTNHSIDPDLVNKVYEDWKAFFADESKHDYLFSSETQDGFYPMSISETAKGYDLKDIKEFFHFYPWGRAPSTIGNETRQLFEEMSGLASELLAKLDAEAPEEVRSKFVMPLSDMISECPRTMLRILHYPPFNGDEPEGAVRAAAHGDINLITLLPAATDAGLQVLDKDGNWQDVPCDYGSIVVNIGDMLDEASDGYYPSTTHRVINPAGDAARRSRLSLPLFCHARNEVRLSDRYTAGEFWTERLRELGHIS